MIQHLQTLGLPANASARDIKKAYRRMALKFHPDRGGSHEKMQEINEAYENAMRLAREPVLVTAGSNVCTETYSATFTFKFS